MGVATSAHMGDLAGRIDATGWGLLMLMTGGLALVPRLPEGTWLAGLGILLLGLNAARSVLGLSLERFTVILGSVAVLAGLGGMVGVAVPGLALLFILSGLAIIVGQVGRGR